jgi:hypothetical protein
MVTVAPVPLPNKGTRWLVTWRTGQVNLPRQQAQSLYFCLCNYFLATVKFFLFSLSERMISLLLSIATKPLIYRVVTCPFRPLAHFPLNINVSCQLFLSFPPLLGFSYYCGCKYQNRSSTDNSTGKATNYSVFPPHKID